MATLFLNKMQIRLLYTKTAELARPPPRVMKHAKREKFLYRADSGWPRSTVLNLSVGIGFRTFAAGEIQTGQEEEGREGEEGKRCDRQEDEESEDSGRQGQEGMCGKFKGMFT